MAIVVPEAVPALAPVPTEAECRAPFERPCAPTVGVEEEVMVLDAHSLELAPGAPDVLGAAGEDPRFCAELPACQLEVKTPPLRSAVEVAEALQGARADLAAAAAAAGHVLATAGTHATSCAEHPLTQGVRYSHLEAEYGWLARRVMTFGLHVHVAIGGADRALAVHDALRSYLPQLAALAGNSPYWDGQDTGLASMRPKLVESFPRQGIPPAFGTWARWTDWIAYGARAGLFPDATYLWYEARLHPRFGTLELRVPDAQTTTADAAAVVAVAHALVVTLAERWDAGEPLAVHETERIAENRWRALRHGLHGELVDLDTGLPAPTRDRVEDLLALVAPVAARQGTGRQIAHAAQLLEGNGADAQRAWAARGGLPAVVAEQAARFLA